MGWESWTAFQAFPRALLSKWLTALAPQTFRYRFTYLLLLLIWVVCSLHTPYPKLAFLIQLPLKFGTWKKANLGVDENVTHVKKWPWNLQRKCFWYICTMAEAVRSIWKMEIDRVALEEWQRHQPLAILQLDPSDRVVLRVAGKTTNFGRDFMTTGCQLQFILRETHQKYSL